MFASHYRTTIENLIRQKPQLEDLADSFPALLFALATGFGNEARRRAALSAVLRGLPLRAAAGELGLPMWLRRLPAYVFQAPLVEPPTAPALVTRLVNLIPPQSAATAPWLERTLTAHNVGGAELALWTAQHYRGVTPAATSESFLRVLAWAWYAGQPGTRGGALLSTRWTPAIGLRRAAKEAHLWLERIALEVCLGAGMRDCWLSDGQAGGYDFVALRDADAFIAEANAMDNCLDRYADRLQSSPVRIFSIRRDGKPVADVEIAIHDREPGMPCISQLRAPRNRRAALELWQAAYAWLGAQPIRPGENKLRLAPTRNQRRKRLDAVWRPFLDALPERVSHELAAQILPPPPVKRHERAQSKTVRCMTPDRA
jgi:hypothetical protein